MNLQPITLNLPGENEYFTQEAYKTLRTNIQFCGQHIRVIAITSVNENEGKSTVSLHIGKSFAELGKRTCADAGFFSKLGFGHILVNQDLPQFFIGNRHFIPPKSNI